MDFTSLAANLASILYLVVFATALMNILVIAGMWATVSKSGQPGWSQIIPIWNILVLLKVAKKPAWWIIWFILLVPIPIVMLITLHSISKNYGKGFGFTLGLFFLPFIFFPVLGFGNAQYQV
jgi:hypothetical protein